MKPYERFVVPIAWVVFGLWVHFTRPTGVAVYIALLLVCALSLGMAFRMSPKDVPLWLLKVVTFGAPLAFLIFEWLARPSATATGGAAIAVISLLLVVIAQSWRRAQSSTDNR